MKQGKIHSNTVGANLIFTRSGERIFWLILKDIPTDVQTVYLQEIWITRAGAGIDDARRGCLLCLGEGVGKGVDAALGMDEIDHILAMAPPFARIEVHLFIAALGKPGRRFPIPVKGPHQHWVTKG